MTDSTDIPRQRPQGLLGSFAIQAAANALGTVIGGVVLGGVALKTGLIRSPSHSALYTLRSLTTLLAETTPAIIAITLAVVWVLNRIEPPKRIRRRKAAAIIVRSTLWSGLVATLLATVFYQMLFTNLFDILPVVPIFVAFGIAILIAEATIRVQLAKDSGKQLDRKPAAR